MFRLSLRVLLPGFLLAQPVSAQPVVRLKSRTVALEPQPDAAPLDPQQNAAPQTLAAGGHVIVQFNDPPTPDLVAALTARGVAVLADVPDNALLVSSGGFAPVGDLGVRLGITLEARDKISPAVADAAAWGRGDFLVALYRHAHPAPPRHIPSHPRT